VLLFEKIRKKINKIYDKKKKEKLDFYLHQYKNYEEYKKIQIFHNKRKLHKVFVTKKVLNIVIREVKKNNPNKKYFALCHGTRNGFEQNYIASKMNVSIIGTDISDTATQFPKSIVWDFHKPNDSWINKCDFIYSNSLDQSFNPKKALVTWLAQLKINGLLFLEYAEDHGPRGAGEMDPFGCKPQYLPYLLNDWFPHAISIKVIHTFAYDKDNIKKPKWIFEIKKIKD
jgi:hypothetical protein